MSNMTTIRLKKVSLQLLLTIVLLLPEWALAGGAFNYNSVGDVLAGFRKTGANAGKYELVVDLGNVTNFLALPAGTTITITNFSNGQLTNAFTDTGGFQYLQWSVFSAFVISGSWTTPLGSFPQDTLWYTLPATNISTQTQPPQGGYYTSQKSTKNEINSIGSSAATISQTLATTNAFLVQEPVATFPQNILSVFIGDNTDISEGDFGGSGNPLSYIVENTTPNPFSAPQRDDFYQVVPINELDPITGQKTGAGYFVGYFLLYPNGTETFTRASAITAPSIGSFAANPTNGFAPLQVVFTNSTSGAITNWVWNFGNGTIITNSSGNAVTNTYSVGGDYTVALTVSGPAGSSSSALTNYIVTSPKPTLGNVTLAGNKFIFGGANGPAGTEYRILESTNLITWFPVFTNVIQGNGAYSYTNSNAQASAYFRLVSP